MSLQERIALMLDQRAHEYELMAKESKTHLANGHPIRVAARIYGHAATAVRAFEETSPADDTPEDGHLPPGGGVES